MHCLILIPNSVAKINVFNQTVRTSNDLWKEGFCSIGVKRFLVIRPWVWLLCTHWCCTVLVRHSAGVVNSKEDTKAVDIWKQKISLCPESPSHSTAAENIWGECQGHCMKHKAFMSTLKKRFLSLVDRWGGCQRLPEKDTICHEKGSRAYKANYLIKTL